ncbi:MAG: dTMP kinase [Armatimonadetes bacterium]|nr:dTMP kinase [Armatimonadota bacterium]
MRGFFVSVEGGEGSGKTTVCQHLGEWLKERGYPVIVSSEPGSTAIGESIRQLLLMERVRDPKTEALLFLAARAEHVDQVLRPHLLDGGIVICDRFTDSTLAYQGFGLGLAIGELERFNDWVTAGLKPDLTILLDIDPELGLKRSQRETVFERRDLSFHQRVRAGYLWLAKREPHRFRIVTASGALEQVLQETRRVVEDALILRGITVVSG